MKRKIGLDLARSLAIGLVLLSHFDRRLEILGLPGVELFFALSGFLIGGILYESFRATPRWRFADATLFWKRRWWRTLPNYYLFLPVALAFQYFVAAPMPTLTQALSYLVFAQDMLGTAPDQFYRISWSLCIEEWFYLLFGLTLYLLAAARLGRKAFTAALVIFVVGPIALRELAFYGHHLDVRSLTLPRLDAIAYGVGMIFVAERFDLSMRLRTALLALGVLGIAALAALYQGLHVAQNPESIAFYRVTLAAMPFSFALMMPWLAAMERLPLGLEALRGWITSISLWSYSLYLCHVPVMFMAYAAFGPLRATTAGNLVSKLAGLVLAILVSKLIYENFEVRITALRPKAPHPRLA